MREGRVGEREDHVDVRIASGVCGGEGVFDVRLELPHGRGECFQPAYLRGVLRGGGGRARAGRRRGGGGGAGGRGGRGARGGRRRGGGAGGAARPAEARRRGRGGE